MSIKILLGIIIGLLVVGLFLIYDKLSDISDSIGDGNDSIKFSIRKLIEDQDS